MKKECIALTGLLPEKGVLFLGGHQNMTKKLKQHFPKWTFVSDDQLKRHGELNQSIVFYWTGHGSHKMMRYAYRRLSNNANVIYVTATNIELLISEMQNTYNLAI